MNPTFSLLAFLFGAAAGWVSGLLICKRCVEVHTDPIGSSEDLRGGGVSNPSPPWTVSWTMTGFPLWGHGLVLGTASLLVSLLPGLGNAFPLSQALLFLFVAYPLSWIDLATLTVEPRLILGGLALRGLSVAFLSGGEMGGEVIDAMTGMLTGAGLLYLVAFAYRELRGRDGLGEGDPAVMGFIGAFVGPSGLLPVLLLSTGLGLILGGGALLFLKKSFRTALPFVPFLCTAGLAVLMAQSVLDLPDWGAIPWSWGR